MAIYTYTIFDADPQSSSGTAWPSHEDIEIEADSDADAIEEVESVMSVEAAGLNPSDGYEAGQSLHALVWSDDGSVVGQPRHELTDDDLGTEPEPAGKWVITNDRGQQIKLGDLDDGVVAYDESGSDVDLDDLSERAEELADAGYGNRASRRILIWESEEDSQNDDGARAIASARWVE